MGAESTTREARERALEKLYHEETSALERAELALTKQQLSSAVYEPFREVVRHYRRLLRQSVKITAVSDRTQLRLRQTSSELTAALARVQQLHDKLVGLQQEKDEIFAMAVHDLKSPLSGIYGMATLLAEESDFDPAERRHVGEDVQRLAGNMLAMVNDLVDVYRLESGEMVFEPQEVAIEDLRVMLSGAHRATARRKHIKLGFPATATTDAAYVDPEIVKRLGDNLISNALKYSPAGTTVTVVLHREADQLVLEVADEGPGISAADQKKLFRKFARLSARPTAGESSSGLGLAVVKRLVDALLGTVSCESTLGAGATFRITLPLAAPPGED